MTSELHPTGVFLTSEQEPSAVRGRALSILDIGCALTHLLAKNYGTTICGSKAYPSSHRPMYEEYFEQDWSAIDRATVEHLVVLQDYAQTSLKRKRQLELRSKIATLFPPCEPKQLIYLKRNDTGVLRTVENENEIIDELSRRGFTILDIKTDSVEKILTHLVVAKIVVSLEGSKEAITSTVAIHCRPVARCCSWSQPTGSRLRTAARPRTLASSSALEAARALAEAQLELTRGIDGGVG